MTAFPSCSWTSTVVSWLLVVDVRVVGNADPDGDGAAVRQGRVLDRRRGAEAHGPTVTTSDGAAMLIA